MPARAATSDARLRETASAPVTATASAADCAATYAPSARGRPASESAPGWRHGSKYARRTTAFSAPQPSVGSASKNNGKSGGEPDPRLAPVWRVVIEAQGRRVGVQTNVPPPVAINLMKDAIVALAQEMVRDESATLVKPVSGAMPPLRRI